MNFIRKMIKGQVINQPPLQMNRIRIILKGPSRQEMIDFGLVLFISFLIVIYKINKV